MGILLLERERQLHALEQALQQAAAGEGSVALVSGEAGIGKTSLVEWFARRQQNGARVLWGACDALLTPHPLSPLHDIAAQTRGELYSLLVSDANRQAVFSACLDELQRRPCIAIFEDLHWADEATLDLIKFLGRRIQRTQSLLILTYRDDEIGAQHPLRLVLGDLPRPATLRIPLLPLSPEAVLELARAAQRSAGVDDLFAATRGNPFFVTEALASEGTSLPATVRDAVLARAVRLSPAARQIINAASVVPGRIEIRLLESVLSPSAEAIEECVERGMLRVDRDALAFRHELARMAVEDALTAFQRQSLHQRVLQKLIEQGENPARLSLIVHHAKYAGDVDAILRFAPAAAAQAASAGAHQEAAAHYQTILHHADRLDPEEHARVLEKRAYECYVTSQIDAAIQARLEALALWRRLGRPLEEGNNLRWLSRLHWFSGRQAPAVQYAKEAIQLLETLPPGEELAMAYSNRAQLHMLANETAEAVLWGQKAIELAERLGDVETLSHALNNVGSAELLAGQTDTGWERLERSLALARAGEMEEHVARAYTNLASEAVRRRENPRALDYLKDGIAYSLECDLDAWTLYMRAWQARANLELGRWSEAVEDALAVIDSPRASPVARIPALAALGRIRVRRGDPGIYKVLDEARDLALHTGEIQRIAPVASARAEAAWWRGDHKLVIAEMQPAYDLARDRVSDVELAELAFWLWRGGGRVEPLADESDPFALQMAGDWRRAAETWRQLGRPFEQALALADGNEAAQLAALEMFQSLGARPAVEWLQTRLAAVPEQRREKERFGGLTAREREAAALVAQGKSNREIAKIMTVGVKTAETYVTRILTKLGFDSRVQIATWAIEKGLAQPPQSTKD